MENYKDKFAEVGLKVEFSEEKWVIETIPGHVKMEFTNETKEYAMFGYLMKDNIDRAVLFSSTMLLSYNIFWTKDGYNKIWDLLSEPKEVSLFDDEESEEEILDELKRIENAKNILGKV